MATDEEIDEIFNFINGLFKKELFSTVDMIIKNIPVERQDSEIILSYMTITLPAKSKLPSRNDFVQRSIETLKERGLSEENWYGLE